MHVCGMHNRYVSYTSGKSIGRLDAPTLGAHSPHHFRTSADVGGRGSPISYQLPPKAAVVLHYESATYEKWLSKYKYTTPLTYLMASQPLALQLILHGATTVCALQCSSTVRTDTMLY